jgi:hypothetical protein
VTLEGRLEAMSPSVLAVLAGLVALAAVVLAAVERRRTRAELRSCHAEIAALRTRVDDLGRAPGRERNEDYVITTLPVVAPVPDDDRVGAGFVSVAAGESLVRLVSLAHGLRRALSPESRNRIGFEMRREVKRARKQRRRDVRDAQRFLRKEAA